MPCAPNLVSRRRVTEAKKSMQSLVTELEEQNRILTENQVPALQCMMLSGGTLTWQGGYVARVTELESELDRILARERQLLQQV